jgi:hypothetical protein
MTEETNTTTNQTQLREQLLVASPLSHDVKNAVLIVSIVLNLIVLTTWIAVQVTSQYDSQIVRLLFNS